MKLNENYNIGYICTKLQCESGHGSKTAFVWISAQGERFSLAFDDLECESNRHANILSNLGFKQGDIFFTFLPKCPEQFYSFLGTLKLKVICGTLFSNFGDEALLDRLGDSKAKGLITKRSFLKKISRIRKHLPYLKYILVTDLDFHQSDDILSYSSLMSESSSDFQTPQTSPNTPSVLHYTSGSTGKPKGVLHVHGSVDMQRATSRKVLKLESDDIYWCTADQGWVTGTSYGIIGPWSGGITQVHFGGMYDASRWCDILQSENVTIWYTAPTALRMLMREDSTFLHAMTSHA